jgi:hypothetical protein
MELDPVMNQIPIIFHTTTRMQPKWALIWKLPPGIRQLALHFEASIAIKSDATCQDFLQSYWKIPTRHLNNTSPI